MKKQDVINLGYDYCYYICSDYEMQSKKLKLFMKQAELYEEDCTSTYNPFKENSHNYKWFGAGFTKAYREIKEYSNTEDALADGPYIDGMFDLVWAYKDANQGLMRNKKVDSLIKKYEDGLVALLDAAKLIRKHRVYFDCDFANPYNEE